MSVKNTEMAVEQDKTKNSGEVDQLSKHQVDIRLPNGTRVRLYGLGILLGVVAITAAVYLVSNGLL